MYHLWCSKRGGMSVPDAKRLKALETENVRVMKPLVEQALEQATIREALRRRS